MKVGELSGALLDYWVARAEGYSESVDSLMMHIDGSCRIAWHEGDDADSLFNPSASWAWGGPIIDRVPFGIFERFEGCWAAGIYRPQPGMWGLCVSYQLGDTLLIAAMRAYVASNFGDEVSDEI